MHELAITERILEICLKAAAEKNAARIREVYLCMGPFSGVVPECVELYFSVLAQDTIAKDAVLHTTCLPVKVHCQDCGAESEITRTSIACPRCKSLRLKMLSGKEFFVDRLEVDTDGDKSAASGDGVE